MMTDLNRWESRLVLEALRILEEKWITTIDNTEDEDVQSEYGNDLAQLQLVKERLEALACKEFGPAVTQFPRVPAA